MADISEFKAFPGVCADDKPPAEMTHKGLEGLAGFMCLDNILPIREWLSGLIIVLI